MSRLVGEAYRPVNGAPQEIWEGFSWPCLFFGFLWYLYKGMWGWGLIALILAICTFGISWLIFPFFANGQFAKSLLEKGYLNEKQWEERNKPRASIAQNTKGSLVGDELIKLAGLKEKGLVAGEEFERQKRKLLA